MKMKGNMNSNIKVEGSGEMKRYVREEERLKKV